MSEYKLVPFEPTPEMVSAAEDAYMPFGDMDLALRMAILAAPDVQGDPVYLYRRRGLHDFVTCNHDRYAELSAKPHLFETKVLYAAPQPAEQKPAPDVAKLLADDEALEGCLEWLQTQELTVNVGETSVEGVDTQLESSAGWLARLLTNALAAHRSRGEI